MSKAATKALIDANITANGTQAITGPILNNVLNTMVDDYGTQEEVSQVAQKIDEFAQGKFYGYFGDVSELPAGDIPGFAYVGTQPPFAIYNYDGDTWTDSGLTVNGIPVGNGEDIDFNADGLLQFANRVYDAQDPNGMGYVILRKNKTFAEQVTLVNTIYEIRYDFDLGGVPFDMPSGCSILFNGGSISNGTLNGNGTKLIGQISFGTNVSFSGSFGCDCPITPILFGCPINDSQTDASPYISKALELAYYANGECFIPTGAFYVKTTITYTFDSIAMRGCGVISAIYCNDDFIDFQNTDCHALISDIYVTKNTSEGTGRYFGGVCFKNASFNSSKIDNVRCTYFAIFIRGWIHLCSVISNCFVSGLGYSFLSTSDISDFENGTLGVADACTDSVICNNYINCAVVGNVSHPLPSNRSLIMGGFSSSRFESNFCDYWKSIFDSGDPSAAGHFKGMTIANNFFDRCMSIIYHALNHNTMTFVGNTIYFCKYSDNTSGNWERSQDPDYLAKKPWCMIRMVRFAKDDVISGNTFNADIALISYANTYPVNLCSISDIPMYMTAFGRHNSVSNIIDEPLFNGKKLGRKGNALMRNDISPIKSPVNNVVTFDGDKTIFNFGKNYYPVESSGFELGTYLYDDVSKNPALVDLNVSAFAHTYKYITINDTKYIVRVDGNDKIWGVVSGDFLTIRQAVLDGLFVAGTSVTIIDKDCIVTQFGGATPYCRQNDYANTYFGNVRLIVDSLPESSLYINRLVIFDNKWYRYTYDGWVEDAGFQPIKNSGTTAQRPQTYFSYVGMTYFDTDLGKMILWNGTAWVNMDGSALS